MGQIENLKKQIEIEIQTKNNENPKQEEKIQEISDLMNNMKTKIDTCVVEKTKYEKQIQEQIETINNQTQIIESKTLELENTVYQKDICLKNLDKERKEMEIKKI